MDKQQVKDWIKATGYDRSWDFRRLEDIAHDEEIPPEYWDFIDEIEGEESGQ